MPFLSGKCLPYHQGAASLALNYVLVGPSPRSTILFKQYSHSKKKAIQVICQIFPNLDFVKITKEY